MLNSKDAAGFLRPLAGVAQDLHTIAIPGEANSLTAQDLAAAAHSVGLPATPAGSLQEAAAALTKNGAARPPRVLICGSLYLAGHVLADHG